MAHSALLEVILVLGSATLVATLFHSLRIPTVVGFIATGVLIGPYSFGLVGSVPGAQNITEAAVLFLMFTLGLEFSPRQVLRLQRPFFRVGLFQFLVTLALVAAVAYLLLDQPGRKSLFIGGLVAMSSTAIVMKLLEDSRELHSPTGECCLGTLLLQDLAVIPLMIFAPMLAGSTASPGHDLTLLLGAPLVLAALWFGGRFAVPWAFDRILQTRSREVFFFAVLSFCLGVAWVVEQVGLSLSFGAFIAGLLVSGSPYVKQIAADIIHLRDNFLGIFFTSLGMLLDPSFLAANGLWVVVLATGLILAKAGVVFGAARLAKYPPAVAAISALSLAQVGEFSFVLVTQGATRGLFNEMELQYFMSVSLVSLLATPFLFRAAPKWFAGSTRSVFRTSAIPQVPAAEKQGHTLIVGYGPVGQDVAAALKTLGIPYQVLDLNPDIVKKNRAQGEPIHYGDASQPPVLHAAGIDTAKLVVIAVSGQFMTRNALSAIRACRPDIPIIVRAQYLRELDDLQLDSQTDCVVAEFETSAEMLTKTLVAYGVEADRIRGMVGTLRRRMEGLGKALWGSVGSLKLPAWEAISRIRPLPLGAGMAALGRSLGELRLRELTGTNVVCVFREGLGTTIPGADFVLQEGDVLHLIGSPEGLASAEAHLRGTHSG